MLKCPLYGGVHMCRYGGKVTQSVSKKTSYLLVGEEAGESKLAKVTTHGNT